MDHRAEPQHHPAGILSDVLIIAGLGPGDLSRTPAGVREALLDPDRRVILRTGQHPAAAQLAGSRQVTTCDDLYDAGETFDEVYEAIVSRVMEVAETSPVIYATPGSPLYGERTVAELRARCRAAGRPVELRHAPSFLDEVFSVLDLDPTERGFTVLDGRDLPDPLMLGLPTVVFQVDTAPVLDEALRRLGRTLPDSTPVTVLSDLGTEQPLIRTYPIAEVPAEAAGSRTSVFIDPPEAGLVGAIRAMRRLRRECPWDERQTHESLTPYAVEETFELLEAIGRLPPGAPDGDEVDYVAYHDVEEELGDVLLQVIFHSNLAAEAGAFDIEDVAETLRRKLVRRHPHVFDTLEVRDAEEVIANWVEIKAGEKHRESLMDGVPTALPGLDRAVKLQKRATRVGFDWPDARSVVADVEEEIEELVEVIDQGEEADPADADHELGDVLFAVANLARHLNVAPELALRKAVNRFESRFRRMEELDNLASADLARLDALWEQAKREERP